MSQKIKHRRMSSPKWQFYYTAQFLICQLLFKNYFIDNTPRGNLIKFQIASWLTCISYIVLKIKISRTYIWYRRLLFPSTYKKTTPKNQIVFLYRGGFRNAVAYFHSMLQIFYWKLILMIATIYIYILSFNLLFSSD